MIGAIAGDVIGSRYEHDHIKSKDFELFHPHCRFTDDTVLTVAVAAAILAEGDYARYIREFGLRYPRAGYGGMFIDWLGSDDPQPYNSWGNGSAMRVSPVGFALDDEMEVLREAKATAVVTHDHPEGIKGAQAAALGILLARKTQDKELLRTELSDRFGYDLSRSVEDIRPGYGFDVSCQGTVPEAVCAFLDSTSYEDAVRNAVSLGGDSDTLACITGAIAEAYYGVPEVIESEARRLLTQDLGSVLDQFCGAYLR
jgi:ADP-ribosylglycohydrolase